MTDRRELLKQKLKGKNPFNQKTLTKCGKLKLEAQLLIDQNKLEELTQEKINEYATSLSQCNANKLAREFLFYKGPTTQPYQEKELEYNL